ncbi:MAG: biosynthetic arginine decarboxylase [Deinococcaceae bacterium]
MKQSFKPADAAELYHVPYWSSGFFRVSERGTMEVTPPGGIYANLQEIIEQLVESGESLPVILRFPQVLAGRVRQLSEAFRRAIEEYDYGGRYQGVFPVKVNQRRMVVETIADAGWDYATGLEAGSKAELALCLAQDLNPRSLLCCNGFKDDGFIRLALWGRSLGKNVVITVEKFSELDRILRIARELDVTPAIGVRFKLHAKGSGQWEESGGDSAKFGLSASELLAVVERLRQEEMLDSLVMIHCHIGSQITDIRRVKVGIREATQVYSNLVKEGVPLQYLNVGGGLAVDYDGSKTTFYTSANYTLQEYASDVVYTIGETCKQAQVSPPTIVTESGRALTAHHAILVLPVTDVTGPTREQPLLLERRQAEHQIIGNMEELLQNINKRNCREIYNDAAADKETIHNLFDLGYLTLYERARGETLYNQILQKVAKIVRDLDYVPEELEDLNKILADKYICNFSLFQSLPDNWAIDTLFPIVPLSRLNERPTREGILVDITCDSDGKIDKFIDLRDVKNTLSLHEWTGNPYYLGVFLVGAYQDVLGSAHNLFGRVNEAHIRVKTGGKYEIELFIKGQKARRMIENMGYEESMLLASIEDQTETAVKKGRLKREIADSFLADYAEELLGYTYLEYEDPHPDGTDDGL